MARKRNNIIQQNQDSSAKIEQEQVEDVPVPPWSAIDIVERQILNIEQFDHKMSPGYGFVPTGGEDLIRDYMNRKVSNSHMPLNRIQDMNIYNYHPQQLTSMYKSDRGKEWYFFTPRSAGKYPNGKQPLRSAGNGFWKASGVDVVIRDDQGIKIGTKKTLVFYEGKVQENSDNKTDWIMHEYRNDNTNNLDECVLCKIYKKTSKDDGNNFSKQQNEQVPDHNKKQGRDDPNLFMQNIQVSNPNKNQNSYGLDFDTWDNLNGQEDGEDLDNMVSSPLSDYEPNLHCWDNGCVYSQQVPIQVPQTVQVLYQYPIFPPQVMVRDDINFPMQNVQNPSSPEACFSCFCFAYVSE